MISSSHLFQIAVGQKLDLADNGGVDIDERLHGRNQKGGGAAGRVEQTQVGQDSNGSIGGRVVGIQVEQQVADTFELAWRQDAGDAGGS